MNDLLNMRQADNVPDGHDRALRAKLRSALHELTAERDPKSSYQYRAAVHAVTDDKNGEVWQVQVSRRRRRQHERMSREHHELDDAIADKVLEDAHGNDISSMIEATKRVRHTRPKTRLALYN